MPETAPSRTEWYLARDGQQYGPITYAEMEKLIELGHLHENDLVWRQGLDEWQPASFAATEIEHIRAAEEATDTTASPLGSTAIGAASETAPQTDDGNTAPSGPDPHQTSATTAATSGEVSAPDQHRPQSAQPTQPDATSSGTNQYAAPDWQTQPTGHPANHARTYADQRMSGRAGPAARHADMRSAGRDFDEPDFEDDDDDDDDLFDERETARRSSWIGRTVAAALVLGVVGGGGWLAYENREQLMTLAGLQQTSGTAPIVSANDQGVRTLAPQDVALKDDANDTVKIPLLETPLWTAITEAFPVWAEQRRDSAMQLQREGVDAAEIQRRLTIEIAKLRRKYGRSALAAQPDVLMGIAKAFLANLEQLTERDVKACYDFIRRGETSASILKLLQDGDKVSGPIQQQLKLVIEASISGRQDPASHPPPLQKDYQLISAELTKMGWSSAEMEMFSDRRKLSQADPATVCKLVTDWFRAHLRLSDPETQTRLLVQSLRPVVEG